MALEESFVWFSIKKFERIFDIMGKAIESSGVALIRNAMDLRFDEVVSRDGWEIFGDTPGGIDAVAMVDHINEGLAVDDPNLEGDFGFLDVAFVLMGVFEIAILIDV